jgi:shikimate 5-dehydrogenase
MQDRRGGGKKLMGYPVDKIGSKTKLFSLIGSSAIEHKKDKYFNNIFKQMDVDCKMMPLNIRNDDIGFFLNGLKDSQIKAVYFEKEYWQIVASLLESDNKEVNFCKICDTIDIKNNTYNLRVSIGEAVIKLLGDVKDKTILILGSSGVAKSVLFNLIKEEPAKIVLAHEVIEELLEMMSIIPDKIVTDIERIQENRVDTKYDISINCMDIDIKSDINTNKEHDKILTKIAEINTKIWSENG